MRGRERLLPGLFLTLIVLVPLAASGAPQSATPCEWCYAGPPSWESELLVLDNIGYTVGYSDSLKSPLWVAYHLFAVANPITYDRPSNFFIDDRTSERLSEDDYEHSGYDCGHMAPNAYITYCYGRVAQLETFLMSNVSPQTRTLNQRVWSSLESYVWCLACSYEEVWVITGPVFCDDGALTSSGVRVPCEFYKIIVDEVDGVPRMLAFIVPQDVQATEPLERYLSSVADIRAKTDLRFFLELDEPLRSVLEEHSPERLWPVLSPSPCSPARQEAVPRTRVDVNTASYVELLEITHIGSDRAYQIRTLRAQRPFCCLDDLSRITGIAAGRIDSIREQGLAYVDPETSGQSYPCQHGWNGE